jgi:FKBP-type peptidyl-prolyl cis-trans isomerase (trigger factor)
MTKIIIGIIVVLALIGGGWYAYSNNLIPSFRGSAQKDPNAVVARVNGVDITRASLSQSETQVAAAQGVDLASLDQESRAQLQTAALDNLIVQILVGQAIAQAEVSASDEEVATQIETIKGQFVDTAAYQAALVAQSMTEADLRAQLVGDLTRQKYFKEILSLDAVTATEEEIRALYDQVAAVQDVPPLEETYDEVETAVIQQKQQALVNAHVAELRATADIEILI